MDLGILGIERILDDEKLKGIATIEIKGIVKVAGIKILQGTHGLYCCCPNQSHTQDGLRKWSNILTFEQDLWNEIQEKILKEYEGENKNVKGKQRI